MLMHLPYKGLLSFIGLLLCFSTAKVLAQQREQIAFKFDFGNGPAAKGYVKVSPDSVFNNQRGYGFDFDSHVSVMVRNPQKKLTGDFITANAPFFFSVNVPEGNYKVTLTLGDITGSSLTTVRAESRRLMLEKFATGNGETKKGELYS